MRRLGRRLGIFLSLLFASASTGAAEIDGYIAEAESVLQRLRGEMMQEMVNAQNLGPEKAIDVCRHLAPEINAKIEDETGWTLRRTGLRVRNPANAAIGDEAALMRSFELRLMAGQPPQLLRSARIIDQDGRKVFNLVQAVPMLDTCLACHGENIDAATAKRISELYPEDKATGYKIGELRGAFSLYKPVAAFAGSTPKRPPTLAELGYVPKTDLKARGDAVQGAELFRHHCRGCHADADLARFVFPTPDTDVKKVCGFLQNHGMTGPKEDCDVAAYLKDVAGFLARTAAKP